MVALVPSHVVDGEFIAQPSNAREEVLLTALGATTRGGRHHLTPARAKKYEALAGGCWQAEGREGGYWFSRGGCKPMRLSDAMRAIAAGAK